MLSGSENQPICVPALATKALRTSAAKAVQSGLAAGAKKAM